MQKKLYFTILTLCTLTTFVLACLRISICNSEIAIEQKHLIEEGIGFKLYTLGEPPDLILLILLIATFTVAFYFIKKISYSILFTVSVLLFMILNSHFWIYIVRFFGFLNNLEALYQQETVQSKLLVIIVEASFIFPLALIETSLLSHFIKKRHHAKISLK